MKTITDLKDVPDGTAMTILQADGTYLCISKIERPDADVAVEPAKSAIVREMESSPLLTAVIDELAALKNVSKEVLIASIEAKAGAVKSTEVVSGK